MDDLLNSAPFGFFSFSDDGIILRVNDGLVTMLGYPRDELVGGHVERVLTVGSRIFYQTHLFPLLRLHGSAEEIFLLLRASSGDDVGALVGATRQIRNDHAEYDVAVMQVRERRKYEDELLRARRVAEDAQAELQRQKLELEEVNRTLESYARKLESQQEYLNDQATALEEASKELHAMNESLLFRTREAEQLRKAAEQANHAKSSFLAAMSHELRTPLNAIGGYVQLLEMGIHGPITEPQRKALSRVAQSQSHLLRLINDVLDLARIEAGRIEYHLETVDVEEAIASVAPMLTPQFESKALSFSMQLESGLAVRTDREKLQQILINLLGNAVKFTPENGSVRVEACRSSESADRVAIAVVDTGTGIPPEKLETIFQPFEQVKGSGTATAQGSGLGLAISRDLARGMGGELSVTSTPGAGSTFTLTLPWVKQ